MPRLLALLLALCTVAAVAACSGSAKDASTATARDVDVPGVDTSQFTPRERHEFSQYVQELPSPCRDVAVPVAQCVLEKRACQACLPAAQAIAKAVRDGMAREQVQDLYKQRFDASSTQAIPIDGSPTRGSATARVTLVEFADFECPFCQQMAPKLDAIVEKRKEHVLFVYKFMPLKAHPHGVPAARAAIAAQQQGKFWEMHHLLFANREHLEPADLEGYAKGLGLDMDRFHADVDSAQTSSRLDTDRRLADGLNVHGTPTIFIDGREYDTKADLVEWLDQEIAARK
jgi:thiol-disulfide isomerase/thioredoxin